MTGLNFEDISTTIKEDLKSLLIFFQSPTNSPTIPKAVYYTSKNELKIAKFIK